MSGTSGTNPARVGVNTNIKQFNNTTPASIQWFYKNGKVVPQQIKQGAADVLIQGDLRVNGDETVEGDLTVNGIINPSDIILKEDIQYLKNTARYDDVLHLEPATYNFIEDISKKQRFGLIAQDVEQIFPELVTDTINSSTQTTIKSVNYIDLIPIMLHKMKQMQNEIDMLKSNKVGIDTLNATIGDYNYSNMRQISSLKVDIANNAKMIAKMGKNAK